MAGNSFGTLFRFTSWGESHGPAIGCVVDGTPPRIPLSEADIQVWMEKRRPGQSRFVTQRQEPDTVKILSGVFEGVTTGTPIALHIDNVDQRSRDYSRDQGQVPPGPRRLHLFQEIRRARLSRRRPPVGARDRGARRRRRHRAQDPGRRRQRSAAPWCSSAARRSTAASGTGTPPADNPFWCPDRQAAQGWEGYLDDVRKRGSSCGAVIEVVASGVPVGLGDPVYDKLDADLAKALMSINAVKGVEIGDGFATAAMSGEDNADEMRMKDGAPAFLSNHAGGILGGISTGQDIVCRLVGEADQLDPRAGAQHRPLRQRGRAAHQGPPRSLRRHPRHAGRRGDGGLRAGRPSAAPSRAVRLRSRRWLPSPWRRATARCTTSAWPSSRPA